MHISTNQKLGAKIVPLSYEPDIIWILTDFFGAKKVHSKNTSENLFTICSAQNPDKKICSVILL
jgi:hypothetical protein